MVPDGEPVGVGDAAAAQGGARVVLTTGGTGLTPTDRTPEVTRALLDHEVPGIAEAIRAYGVAQGRADRGALPRARRGDRAAAWSSTCRARAGACKDGLTVLRPVLVHAAEQVVGERPLSRPVGRRGSARVRTRS